MVSNNPKVNHISVVESNCPPNLVFSFLSVKSLSLEIKSNQIQNPS